MRADDQGPAAPDGRGRRSSDCAAGIKRAGELNPAVAQFNQVKVNHVEVNGDRASVTGAVPTIKKNATFQLQRVNGKWLVSSTGG